MEAKGSSEGSIVYAAEAKVSTDEVLEVFKSAGVNRPLDDYKTIEAMFDNSNLICTARIEGRLVGVARSVTDFVFCCYLSDLAVTKEHQNRGIGKELVRLTKEKAGDRSMLLLLAAPSAMGYYPKLGMDKCDNAFITLGNSPY